MTLRAWLLIVTSLMLNQAGQRPVFRATGLGVTVHVSVWNGQTMVDRLQAADFELRDNGVMQRVTAVGIESVPVDVSFVVDTSGSVVGSLSKFKTALGAMLQMLRPSDRARVITFNMRVREAVPMRLVGAPPDLSGLHAGGGTALYDAIDFALKWPSDPSRRHLVLVLTDGYDTASKTPPWLLPLSSAKSESVLFAGLAEPAAGTAVDVPNLDALRRAAVETGGRLSPFRDGVDFFHQLLREFRSSYVLRYTPLGVASEGWHDVEVTIVGRPQYVVQARKGYFGS